MNPSRLIKRRLARGLSAIGLAEVRSAQRRMYAGLHSQDLAQAADHRRAAERMPPGTLRRAACTTLHAAALADALRHRSAWASKDGRLP